MQWAVGQGYSHDELREKYEAALSAVGTRPDKGGLLWEAYRSWETVLLGVHFSISTTCR